MCDYIESIGSLKVVYKTLHKTVVDPVLQIREGSHPDPETRGRGGGGRLALAPPLDPPLQELRRHSYSMDARARRQITKICNHICNHVLEKKTQSSEQEPRNGFI